MFRKIKVDEGSKYDATKVPTEELTAEELKELKKKAQKMIDIYKGADGNTEDLSYIDLAKAMDDFSRAAGEDGEISKEEMNDYLEMLNQGRNKKDKVDAGEVKDFFNALKKITSKKDGGTVKNKDDVLSDFVADKNGFSPVEGHARTYKDADGRYVTYDHKSQSGTDVKYDSESQTYVPMTNEEIYDREIAITVKKAVENHNGDAMEGHPDGIMKNGVIYKGHIVETEDGEKTVNFARATYGSDGKLRLLSDEEIAKEDAQIVENKAAKAGGYEKHEGYYSKDGQNFIYKNGEFVRAKVINNQPREMTEAELAKEQPSKYVIQLGERYDDLIKRSLKSLHEGEEGYTPSKEEIDAAKAQFKAENPKAFTKNGKYLLAGAEVKIRGSLTYADDKEKTQIKYQKYLDNQNIKERDLKKKNYIGVKSQKAAAHPDYIMKDEKGSELIYYKWDKKRKDFYEVKNLMYVDKDGTCTYGIKGQNNQRIFRKVVSANGQEVRRFAENLALPVDKQAEKCGLKKAKTGDRYYRTENGKTYYYKHEKNGYFVPVKS